MSSKICLEKRSEIIFNKPWSIQEPSFLIWLSFKLFK
jgi:hypothetical protein